MQDHGNPVIALRTLGIFVYQDRVRYVSPGVSAAIQRTPYRHQLGISTPCSRLQGSQVYSPPPRAIEPG